MRTAKTLIRLGERVIWWFCRAAAHLIQEPKLVECLGSERYTADRLKILHATITVNIIKKIRISEKCAVISLKFEQGGFTVE